MPLPQKYLLARENIEDDGEEEEVVNEVKKITTTTLGMPHFTKIAVFWGWGANPCLKKLQNL